MTTKKGVWNLQQVRDKQLQSLWAYSGSASMLAWGSNPGGKLGLNNATPTASHIQFSGNWSHIEANPNSGGNKQIGAVNSDGELFTWGPNQYGALGVNDQSFDEASSPIQVGSGTDWARIGAGNKNMGATKTDGTLWVWGDARDGALGQNGPINVHRSSPIQIPGTNWGTNHLALASYDRQYLAVKTNGTLWSWGNNDGGRLGINTPGHRSSPIQIPGTTWALCAMGKNNSYAIKTDGTMWAWGDNDYGRLGINAAHGSQWSSPKQIPGTTWKSTGKSLSVSPDGMMAIKTDGTLWSWGYNNKGQLGINDKTHRSSPVQIPGTTWNIIDQGKYLKLAIKTDGTMWSWGEGVNPGDGTTLQRSSPVQIGSDTNWSGMSLSYQTQFGLKPVDV